MKFRIKYADRIVGLFVVLAGLVLVAMIVLAGVNQRWFSRDYRFTASFQTASGLAPGTAILMKGFQVGKIEKVELTEENVVEVGLVIYDTYYPKVREHSLLELVSSPIGLGTQLLFHPGKGESLIPEGGVMVVADSEAGRAIIERELADIPPKDDTITRLLAGVGPLLENVNKTVVAVNRTLAEVNLALAGQSPGPLGGIVRDAADTVAGIEDLVGDVGRSVGQVTTQAGDAVGDLVGQATTAVADITERANALLLQAEELAASVTRISGNLEATTTALRDPTGLVPLLLDPKGSLKTLLDDDNRLYGRIDAAIASVEGSLRSVQSMTASLAGQMPQVAAALEETRGTIKSAQDVLESLKNNPLLKGGVPARVEQATLYQSLREGEF
jgi:phospholipid/cholesterol/gamma-HCH transport system substrate-binding protein